MQSLQRIISVPAHLLLGLFLLRRESLTEISHFCLTLTYRLSESQALPSHFKYMSMGGESESEAGGKKWEVHQE